jgi:hypothetical protein
MFDNDATGCFDCIIVSLVMIAALQLGMPWPAACMHWLVLLHMEYFIKMAHGISDAYYSVIQDYLCMVLAKEVGHPLPSGCWLLLFYCFCLPSLHYWQCLLSIHGGNILEEWNADSIVDDTSTRCNDSHLDKAMPYVELIAKAQACAQIWERLLYSSGGALELRKCFWYLVYWGSW